MRVLITGSRDYTNLSAILRDMRELDHDARSDHSSGRHVGERLTIIHGRAKTGADMLARRVANILGANLWEIPAEWDYYRWALNNPKAAGHIRNAEMLTEYLPDMVYAYPLPQSRGTWNCVRLARAMGIPVIVR